MSDICDLGDFSEFIVPPNQVTAKPINRRGAKYRRWNITRITRPTRPSKWHPLLVIGNAKSGNNDGAAFLNSFRGQLNPAQVVDLGNTKMEEGLRFCQAVSDGCKDQDVQCLVLVAGGDGTVG
jgi:hypothetical protein